MIIIYDDGEIYAIDETAIYDPFPEVEMEDIDPHASNNANR